MQWTGRMLPIDSLPTCKPELRARGESLVPEKRAGDFAQALMDLGATICTPRKPVCALCPWRDCCQAFQAGNAEELPRKAEKAERPKRMGVIFWAVDETGAVLLRRRQPKGLLGGMMEFPSTGWAATLPVNPAAAAPIEAEWRVLPGAVRHVFTHFELTLTVWAARIAGLGDARLGAWITPNRFADHALPSLMQKVARHALGKAAR